MKAFGDAAATAVAALMTTALLGTVPVQARGGGMHFSTPSAPHVSISTRSVTSFNTKSVVKINKTNTTLHRAVVHHEPHIKHVTKIDKSVLKTVSGSNGAQGKGHGKGKLTLTKLPLLKATAGNANLAGRLHVPIGLKPKLTLAHIPNANLKLRLAPFVQRQWRRRRSTACARPCRALPPTATWRRWCPRWKRARPARSNPSSSASGTAP